MEHKHGKVVIEIKADGDHIVGKIEGTKHDIEHVLLSLIDTDKQFESIFIEVAQAKAKEEMIKALKELERELELKKGKEIKN